MTKKKLYPGTALDRKLLKREAKSTREKNFVELVKFYELHSQKFNQADPSPWKELCLKIMEHLIPGFQENRSGNKRRNTYQSDIEIATWLQFDCILPNGEIHHEKYDQRVQNAAKFFKTTSSKIKHAVERSSRFLTEHPNIVHGFPSNDGTQDYYVIEPSVDRNIRNRKKDKLIPK